MTENMEISCDKTKSFVQILLSWSSGRNFPWRQTKTPYHILIAEIMLQRTKAEQVVPVFRCFLEYFPDLKSLASSKVEQIEKCIKPLGLRKRAIVFNRLAKQVVDEYEGIIPSSRKEILSLYGVGNYVANAVLCHAFGQDLPTVDANFARVLKRVFSLQLKKPEQKDPKAWTFANEIMLNAKGHCRNLNLGVIDLANLICVPRNPKCPICPLDKICDYAQIIMKLENANLC